MNKHIERVKNTRLFLLDMVKDLSEEQMNEVPANFNNNIIWNLGHLISAQQGICYVRSGGQPVVDKSLFEPYRPGTKPEQFIDAASIEIIKEASISSLNKLTIDYDNEVFSNYVPWTSRYGVTINDIDDAIAFIGFHEGLHTGAIQALKRNLKK